MNNVVNNGSTLGASHLPSDPEGRTNNKRFKNSGENGSQVKRLTNDNAKLKDLFHEHIQRYNQDMAEMREMVSKLTNPTVGNIATPPSSLIQQGTLSQLARLASVKLLKKQIEREPTAPVPAPLSQRPQSVPPGAAIKIFSGEKVWCLPPSILDDGMHSGKIYHHTTGLKIYEGSLWNGMTHGKGILYRTDGPVLYVGEFMNGEPNGKGTSYHTDGTVRYVGEFMNAESHGIGRTYRTDGTVFFEGKFVNGRLHGKGREFHPNGILHYVGDYMNGEPHGNGRAYRPDRALAYKGEYANGRPHGKGKEYGTDRTLAYEGKFVDGKRLR